jgi:hypothetical protein
VTGEEAEQLDGDSAVAAEVPEDMRQEQAWVGYAPDPDTGKAKCPVIISAKARRASTRKPVTWDTFERALLFHQKYGRDEGHGIGFVFKRTSGRIYIDVDCALDARGELREWAKRFVEPFMGKAYIEVSPSGRGLHIIGKGTLPGEEEGGVAKFAAHAQADGRVPEVAVFCAGKYTTITGKAWKGSTSNVQDVSEEVAALWAAAGIGGKFGKVVQPGDAPVELLQVSDVPPSVKRELDECSAGEESDRSAARFKFYVQASEQGLTPEEIYSLVRGSDWYEASGAAEKGPSHTWQDICRSVGKVATSADEKTKEKDAAEQAAMETALTQLKRATSRFTVEELSGAPPPERFIWQPFLATGKVATLLGQGGLGKSAFGADLAVSRAVGRPFLGMNVPEGKTVILTVEDDRDDYRRKFAALREVDPTLDMAKVAERVTVVDVSSIAFRLVTVDYGVGTPSTEAHALIQHLCEACGEADLVIMETVNRLAGGAEGNDAFYAITTAAGMLARKLDAAVLLVHHLSKSAARDNTADSYAGRGGAALADNSRSVLNLNRVDEKDPALMTLVKASLRSPDQLVVLRQTKSPPSVRPAEMMLLEKRGTDFGLVLTPVVVDPDILAAARDHAAQPVGARIREVLFELIKANPKLAGKGISRTALSKLHIKYGLTKRGAGDAIEEALAAGFLRVSDEKAHNTDGLLPGAVS